MEELPGGFRLHPRTCTRTGAFPRGNRATVMVRSLLTSVFLTSLASSFARIYYLNRSDTDTEPTIPPIPFADVC